VSQPYCRWRSKRFCAIDPRFKPCGLRQQTQLGDRTIPADRIVWLGGANRDETQFEQAEKFGRSHAQSSSCFWQRDSLCLGAPLARLEGKLVLKAVLDRLPNLQIDPIAALIHSSSDIHGVKSTCFVLIHSTNIFNGGNNANCNEGSDDGEPRSANLLQGLFLSFLIWLSATVVLRLGTHLLSLTAIGAWSAVPVSLTCLPLLVYAIFQ